jgi:hypothetical protein
LELALPVGIISETPLCDKEFFSRGLSTIASSHEAGRFDFTTRKQQTNAQQ